MSPVDPRHQNRRLCLRNLTQYWLFGRVTSYHPRPINLPRLHRSFWVGKEQNVGTQVITSCFRSLPASASTVQVSLQDDARLTIARNPPLIRKSHQAIAASIHHALLSSQNHLCPLQKSPPTPTTFSHQSKPLRFSPPPGHLSTSNLPPPLAPHHLLQSPSLPVDCASPAPYKPPTCNRSATKAAQHTITPSARCNSAPSPSATSSSWPTSPCARPSTSSSAPRGLSLYPRSCSVGPSSSPISLIRTARRILRGSR